MTGRYQAQAPRGSDSLGLGAWESAFCSKFPKWCCPVSPALRTCHLDGHTVAGEMGPGPGPPSQEVWLGSALHWAGLGMFPHRHSPQPMVQGARAGRSSLGGHRAGPESPGSTGGRPPGGRFLSLTHQPSGSRRLFRLTSDRLVVSGGGDSHGAPLVHIYQVSQPGRREGNQPRLEGRPPSRAVDTPCGTMFL